MDFASRNTNTTNANNQKDKKGKFRLPHFSNRQLTVIIAVLATILVLGLFLGTYKLGYNHGYNHGYKAGEEKGKQANRLDPLGLFRNGQNPLSVETGKLEEVKDDSIVLDTSRGERKEIKLTDKTKITKKTDTLSKSDLKAGMKVSVFLSGGDEPTATRIVLR